MSTFHGCASERSDRKIGSQETDLGATRDHQARASEPGAQIDQHWRVAADLGATLQRIPWWAPETGAQIGAGTTRRGGQCWQRGQKQVDLPPETVRTIVALPQVRQRWPARS